MKPLPLEEIERVFTEIMDELEPDVRERVLDKLIMQAFMQTCEENPNWCEDNPELARMSARWIRKKMDGPDPYADED